MLGSARWLLRLAPDPVGASAAEHAAREELRKAQYHRDDPSVFSRVVSWLLRRLDVLLSGSPAGNALLVLLVLLAAVVIFAVVHAGPPRRAARLRGPDAEDPLRPLASADHRRLAADFEAQGRHAEALREWLRAAVRSIEDRGVLPPLPGRTGAATAREAGPLLPAAADGLRAATLAFDEVWFGGRDATAADVGLARATADAVLSARVGQPAGTPSAPGYALPW